MSARTYGKYQFDKTTGARGSWLLDLEPAAAIRAKRVFGRVQQGRTGTLVISHTIEVARDIEWFIQRWPLKAADKASAGMLANAAVAHREQELAVGKVLARPPRLKLDAGTLLKTPYPYQVKSLEMLRVRHRILVTDEVGLGKTLTGLLNLTDETARPAVIVPPTHLPPRWVTELNESMPWLTVEVAKKTKPPQHIIDGDFPDVMIVPYSKLAGWRDALAGRVRSVIFDEVQELRNGTSTDKGFAAAHIASEADFVMGLTATPVYNILSNSGTREERWRASGDLDWKMREATGIAKAPYVAEFVRLLLESEEKVALFGWHRAVWDLWQESLREFRPVMYTGTESPTQKAAAEEEFKSGRSRIMMMSLRSGSGIDGLQKVCSVAVFGELDWSPQVHEQAIGRFRRDGMDEDKPVVAYFLHSTEGSDPPILEALQIKRNQAEPLVSKDGKLLDNAIHDLNRSRALAEAVLRLTGTHMPAADPWTVPTVGPAALSPRDTLTPLWEETNA